MTAFLHCHERFHLGERRGLSRQIYVKDEAGAALPQFELMCAAIDGDIQSAAGSGKTELNNIRIVESGEADSVEASGNAWVIYITPDKVWFEGLYSQGEGGEVSFAQYKLAVETYVRFLSDPLRLAITVEFPE